MAGMICHGMKKSHALQNLDLRNHAAANPSKTVIPYFKNFIKKFLSQKKLSQASEEQVLAAWSWIGVLSKS